MKKKRCFKCGEEKSLDNFYKHPMMKDGTVNKCKECNKKDVAENYRANINHYINYEKERFKRPERKKQIKEYQRKRRSLNYEKYKANNIISNAIRDGKLSKKPCEICGDLNSEAHHYDYSKPLDVKWLCRAHHLELHGKIAHSTLQDREAMAD